MKNAILLCLSTLVCLSLVSQKNNTDRQYRYDKYMKSSHRKLTAGFIFLGSGAAVAAAGIILIVDGSNRNDSYSYSYENGTLEQALGVVTTVLGAGLMGGSIPFFVGAHRSRERAISLSFKAEKAPLLYRSAFARQPFPALALHIPLGR